jgi:phosphoenolpyruvate synthase/pyruvate phosphate dikinase
MLSKIGRGPSHGSKLTVSIIWLDELGRGDVASVGGKNASLGEMMRHLRSQGIKVPPGFATTAGAYWRFIDSNHLGPLIAANVTAGAVDIAAVPVTRTEIMLNLAEITTGA